MIHITVCDSASFCIDDLLNNKITSRSAAGASASLSVACLSTGAVIMSYFDFS